MEKKFLIHPDSFKAFAYYARGTLFADGRLGQSMAYLIGYKFDDDTYVSTELIIPNQESYSNNCKELGMTLYFKRTNKVCKLKASNSSKM